MHEHHEHDEQTPVLRPTSPLDPSSVAVHELEAHHPEPATYLKVATVLVVLTAFEVGVYYVHGLGLAMMPILLTLAAAKFSLVALFYMHLKFDNPIFARLFVFGLLIAASILVALLALFAYHTIV
jgi:cytochrome c oxidase subunit 4